MNLYLHIPFCRQKCAYCHFNSTTNPESIAQYVSALIFEIDARQPQNSHISTIYFGGGTPNLLSISQIRSLLKTIFVKSSNIPKEITIECNPESMVPKYIDDLINLGINRFSIGIQTWNQSILSKLNRRTNPELTRKVLSSLSQKQVNFNVDHIVGLPDQSIAQVKDDILISLQFNPTHFSIYPLEIHPHTKLYTDIKNKQIKSPSSALLVKYFSIVQNLLIQNGYEHYEEFSFSKPGYYCQHNLDFWQGKDYMGLGVSAVSRMGNKIISNTNNIREYSLHTSQNQNSLSKITYLTNKTKRLLNHDLNSRLLISLE
jgi:oxygen-independent coproporphyrinogen III oxidase